MKITTTDYQLIAARAAHRHLKRMHNELYEKIVLQWLRENRKHPKAHAVDSELSLYRLYGDVRNLRKAIDHANLHAESDLP